MMIKTKTAKCTRIHREHSPQAGSSIYISITIEIATRNHPLSNTNSLESFLQVCQTTLKNIEWLNRYEQNVSPKNVQKFIKVA